MYARAADVIEGVTMTVKEIKDFMRSIRSEQAEIMHLKQMIAEEEASLLPKAIVYDKDKVQVCPEERFSTVCAKVAEYQMELGQSIAIIMQKKRRAECMIRELGDEKEREVLRWYYLTTEGGNLLTWGQVAIRMNYYERHIKRIHGNALVHLADKLCEEQEDEADS